VEGNLTELGYDPFAVQVILSEKDETVLYLVNEVVLLRVFPWPLTCPLTARVQ